MSLSNVGGLPLFDYDIWHPQGQTDNSVIGSASDVGAFTTYEVQGNAPMAAAIPEPGTFLLSFVGFGALTVYRQKRRFR